MEYKVKIHNDNKPGSICLIEKSDRKRVWRPFDTMSELVSYLNANGIDVPMENIETIG